MTFRHLEGETAILVNRGVYRQCDLYEWDGKLFARDGGGYVRLKMNGTTSRDGTMLEQLQLDAPLFQDRFGRLCVTEGDGRKRLTGVSETKLLGGAE